MGIFLILIFLLNISKKLQEIIFLIPQIKLSNLVLKDFEGGILTYLIMQQSPW